MQNICVTVLIVVFIIIIIINVSATALYLPTEWNFHYTKTYDDFIVDLVLGSANGSLVRKQCRQDTRCMVLMLQNNITIAQKLEISLTYKILRY